MILKMEDFLNKRKLMSTKDIISELSELKNMNPHIKNDNSAQRYAQLNMELFKRHNELSNIEELTAEQAEELKIIRKTISFNCLTF